MIEGTQILEQLVAAEDQLAESEADLFESQVVALTDALTDAHYDGDRYDEAIRRYREAKRAATAARVAWEQWRRRTQAATAPVATPRLRFARWLYEHGYLSG